MGVFSAKTSTSAPFVIGLKRTIMAGTHAQMRSLSRGGLCSSQHKWG